MVTKHLLSEEVIIDLQDFVKMPYGFVVFVGKNGRGKSHAAMNIYHALAYYKLPAHDHDQAWFINQAELNMQFAEMSQELGHIIPLLKQCQKCKLLILDDLGTRKPSDSFMDFLYAIVDHRWHNRENLGTIITTNLDSPGLRKYFGDAIFSRIASGRNYVFTGEDRRFTELGF